MAARRTIVISGYVVAGLGGALAIMVGPLLVLGPAHAPRYRDPTRLIVMCAAVAIAMAWCVIFSWLTFRRQDEYEQAASKFGWYWGGLIGLGASAPVFAFIAWGGLHWLWPSIPVGRDLFRAIAIGYCLPVFMQVAGFLVAHAYWRATKR